MLVLHGALLVANLLTASLAMYFRYYVNHVKVCTLSPVYSYISEWL